MNVAIKNNELQDEILEVDIYAASVNDWPYIEDSWVRSTFYNTRIARRAHFDRTKILNRIALLRGAGAIFNVATADKNILGWACFEVPVLHYVFVKEYYREQGIARQLLAPFGSQKVIWCSSWAPLVAKIAKEHKYLRNTSPY